MANEEIMRPYDGIAPSDKHIHYPVNEPKVGDDGANTLEKIMDRLTVLEEGGGSGGSGGTEPLIIHVTEEEVKDPQTQKTIGFKTDTLASDAYEAWQNGRPIYYNIEGDEWTVSSVREGNVAILYWQFGGVAEFSLITSPFADGYLVVKSLID